MAAFHLMEYKFIIFDGAFELAGRHPPKRPGSRVNLGDWLKSLDTVMHTYEQQECSHQEQPPHARDRRELTSPKAR